MNDFTPHNNIRMLGSWGGVVEYAGQTPQSQFAVFYLKPVHSPIKSREYGRPYFEDQVYIRVAPPGERLNVVDRPATDQDKRIWSMQWNQFANNHEQIPEGTPIEQLYSDRPAIGATLKANGVHTVEQCATLSANAIENIGMGCQSWVNAAQKYIKQAEKGVAINQHRRDLEERDQQIKILKQQIEEQKTQLSMLQQQIAGAVQMSHIQEAIASAMNRPAFPQGQWGSGQMGQNFDAQTQQINATGNATRRRRNK